MSFGSGINHQNQMLSLPYEMLIRINLEGTKVEFIVAALGCASKLHDKFLLLKSQQLWLHDTGKSHQSCTDSLLPLALLHSTQNYTGYWRRKGTNGITPLRTFQAMIQFCQAQDSCIYNNNTTVTGVTRCFLDKCNAHTIGRISHLAL